MDNRNLHFSKGKQKIIKGAVVFLVILLVVGIFVTREDRKAAKKITETPKVTLPTEKDLDLQAKTTGTARTAFTCSLRASNSTSADVLQTLSPGEDVKILGAKLGKKNMPWYRVSVNGKTGWLAGTVLEYVKLDNSKEEVIEKALAWAKKIANDDTHGYSLDQTVRWGAPDYDCSTFVTSAYRSAGVDLIYAGDSTTMYCSVMRRIYEANGFEWITAEELGITEDDPEPDTLQPGDILLDENQHTAMYVGNGKMVAARQDWGNKEKGDQNGKEIQVSKYHAEYTAGEIHVKWDGVLRYTGGVTNPNAKIIPESLRDESEKTKE